MQRRLHTLWVTFTQQAARRGLDPPSDNDGSGDDPFDWGDNEEKDGEEELELPQQEAAQEPEHRPPLWPNQVVAYNLFATWCNEEAFRRVRSGFEEAGAAAEAASIQASIETARREEQARALMDAERQVYEQLNANAASGEQPALIAQREDESALFMAAQSVAHEEFNAARARNDRRGDIRSQAAELHRMGV